MICKKCGGYGVYIKGGLAFQCNCLFDLKVQKNYSNSRLPSKLLNNSFNKFEFSYYPENVFHERNGKSYREVARCTFEAAKAFAQQYSVDFRGKGLFISGNVGSGKTFLCSAIACYLLEKRIEVLFLVVPDLLDELRASYSSDSEVTETQVLLQATNAPVLILDDLGAHNYTEWTKNKIYTIINNRLNNDKPTIINSNLNLGQIEKYLGERTTSRIVEMCDIYGLFVPKDIRHMKNVERR